MAEEFNVKPFLTKALKLVLEIVIIAIVVLAILLGISRSLFPYIDHYHPYFEKWASDAAGHPVTIKKVEASWRGLYPTLTFNDVNVFDSSQNKMLEIRQLQIGVDVLSSALHRQIKPGLLSLSGSHLIIHKLGPQMLMVNNIKIPFDLSHPDQGGSIHGGLKWILNQGQISVDDVAVDWYGEDGKLLKLTHLKLQLHRQLFSTQLIGVGTIADKIPSRFRFVINVTGSFWQRQNIAASGYIYLKDLDLMPWLNNRQWHGFGINQGRIPHLKLWFKWDNHQLQEIQTLADIGDIQLENAANKQVVELNNASAHAMWQRTSDGWDLAVDQLLMRVNTQLWPLSTFSLQSRQLPDHSSLQFFRANALDLAELRTVLPSVITLPAPTVALLADLNPTGIIRDLQLRQDTAPQQAPNVSLSLDLAGVDSSAKNTIPGVKNFYGQLKITANAGELTLNGRDLELNYPKIFSTPLAISQYAGNLLWFKSLDGWKMRVDDLNIQDDALAVHGDMDLFIPTTIVKVTNSVTDTTLMPVAVRTVEPVQLNKAIKKKAQEITPAAPLTTPVDKLAASLATGPYIRLLLNFSEHDLSKMPRYIPVGVIHPEFASWLKKAFAGGEGMQGGILLQGPLKHFPFDDATGRFEVLTQIQAMDFHFAPGWPLLSKMDGSLAIDGRRMTVDTTSAEILNIPLNAMHAEIADLSHADLLVEGGANADSADGMRFIFNSPLQKVFGKDLENLHASGPMQLGLTLHVPVHTGNDKVKVDGDVVLLPGSKLDMPAWNTTLEQLQGNLHFTESSLTSDNLQAQWLGQPMPIRIYTSPGANNSSALKISLQSQATIAAIQQHYGLDFKGYIQGATSLNGLLQLIHSPSSERLLFTVDSDLNGVAINLPAPFKKSAADKAPSSIQLEMGSNLGPSLLVIRGNYANKVNTSIALTKSNSQTWSFKGGEVRFGSTPAAIPSGIGWLITGNLPSLVWADVEPYLTSLMQPSKKKATSKSNISVINRINLNIGLLNALGMQLNQINIQAQSLADAWQIQLNNAMMAGQVTVPKDLATQPIRGEFQRFALMPGASQAVADVNPGKIPALNLVFHNFSYKEKSFGDVTIITFPSGGSLQIDRLAASSSNFNLTARGEWERSGKNQNRTTLSGNFQSGNLGAALKAWDLTGSLNKGSGSAAFAISWPGPAYDFALDKMNGNFSFAFSDGQIINISQSSQREVGLGRILNLLSLQSLPRRLSLDFSDLTTQGFHFDDMKGDFNLRNGNAFTNNAYLKGSIAKVEIKGRIGLGAKDYDLTMLLTPYVTSSIPVVAGIAGGPIVGAAAFVATKVFSGVVNKMTSHTYKITGPWDSPVINKGD